MTTEPVQTIVAVPTTPLDLRAVRGRTAYAVYLPGASLNGGPLYLGDIFENPNGRWWCPRRSHRVRDCPTREAAAEALLDCVRREQAALVQRAVEAAVRVGGVDIVRAARRGRQCATTYGRSNGN